MKKCNRILCLLFAFLFLFGSFSVSAYASNYQDLLQDNFSYIDVSTLDSTYSSFGQVKLTDSLLYMTVPVGPTYPTSMCFIPLDLEVGETYTLTFNTVTYGNSNLKVYMGLCTLNTTTGDFQNLTDVNSWFDITNSTGIEYSQDFSIDREYSNPVGIYILYEQVTPYSSSVKTIFKYGSFKVLHFGTSQSDKLDGVLGFLDTIKNALVDMQTDIRNFFNNIGTYFSNLGDRISGFFDTLLTNDDENTSAIGEGLVDIWQRIIDKLTLVADGVANDINNSWQQTVSKLETVKNQISAEITSSWQNIVSKLNDLKVNIVNSLSDLGNNIINGIKDLFIPSDDFFENYSQMYYDLASDRFGALFTVFDISDNFIKSFDADKTIEYIDIPLYNFDLMGFNFQFGGWKMYIIPQFDVFTEIVSTIKGFLSVLASFAFIRALKSRYDEIFGG